MPDRAERSFADFVAHEGEHLRRLAVLLEDDADDADELVRGVLVTLRSRWRRLAHRDDLLGEGRRVLVRRVLTRRPSDGPRTSGWVDDPYAGWDVAEHDDLRRALSGLPTPTRVAVVLSLWAGLPDGEIGDLLRAPEDTVRGELVSGLAPLRAALAPIATPWHVGARLPDDAELRAELTALAEDELSPLDAAAAAAAAEKKVQARRRRRWPIAVAAAAAAVVLVVPAVTGKEPTAPQAADSQDGSRVPPVPAAVDISALPARGSLADDRAFLAGLLKQPWKGSAAADFPSDVTTAPDTRRVLFAGDVPAGRWALVTGRPEPVEGHEHGIGLPFASDDLIMAWFTGPPGAAPEDMTMSSYPYPLVPGMTPALLDPPSGTLLVVGAPGDAIEVSERVEVNADGSDTRTWTPAEVDDGIALAPIDPADVPWTWAVNYRVFRDGDLLTSSPPDGIYTTTLEEDLPDLGIDYPGGKPDAAGRRAADWAAFIGLSALGAPTADTQVTARVVEPVKGGQGTVAMVTVTLPSGAYLVSAQWAWDVTSEFPGGADCGLDVRPALPPPDERLLVASCDMFDPLDGRVLGTVLVASVPAGVASLRLYRANGSYLAEREVTGRSLVTPMPQGTHSVEAVTAGGVLLGRSDLLGHWSPSTD